MQVAINLITTRVLQNITEPETPAQNGHDTDGMQDPYMTIFSAGVLLLILSAIGYAACGRTCRSSESSCCNRLLSRFSGRVNADPTFDATTPGNSV